jgi:hypothetical protein
VQVAEKADAVRLHLPWRRRDPAPEKKNVLVVDAAGKTVSNRIAVRINREFGDVVFQADAAGEYFVYYMPFTEKAVDWNYSMEYSAPQSTADSAWLKRNGLSSAQLGDGRWRALPEAKVREFQTWNTFHRCDPMEVIATEAETRQLVAVHSGRPYLLFPEDRQYPIRMSDDLPSRWIRRGPSDEFHGEACRGEFYVFQVGVFAAREAIDDLTADVGDLRPERGPAIPATAFHAFNFGGTDWLGRPMKLRLHVPRGKVAALWFGVQIPVTAEPGPYQATLALRAKGSDVSPVRLKIDVLPQTLPDGGVSDLWRLARLKWLDSTIALDDEIVAPYTPLSTSGTRAECLGRTVTFAETGLLQSITSGRREVLAAPVAVLVDTGRGMVAWTGGRPALTQPAPGAVLCQSQSAGSHLTMTCRAKMEFDGYIGYRVRLTADRTVQLKDIRLEVPLRRDLATYMMGLGRRGGYRPKQWRDRQGPKMVWLGDVDAGLQCRFQGSQDKGDPFGRGGITLAEEGETVMLRAESGPRTVQAGQELDFQFSLLVTPVKPLDPAHWQQRYYHYYKQVVPVETIARSGANIINCHQGNELNPNINYPFLMIGPMTAYVNEAHAKGLKVKVYYTVRELSDYVAEIWPLRSLGTEIFVGGGGGGHAWLREHLVSDYCPAWHDPLGNGEVDAAIATTGLSRWHNYYLEGLAYLIRHVGIDGLYLDGIGYDREIMKRVRKVLDRTRPGCLIDFHSGDDFPGSKNSPANGNLEHFPYINSLWFGEGYDYDSAPDYWLVEISGIPFGLYGEMLEGGGNPWRGMVYGMTNRLGWGGDPRPIWKLWDQFGIGDARMVGYWDKACPVKTGRPDVLATAYLKPGKTLVSLASWAPEPVDSRLTIDWRRLGLDPRKTSMYAPAIEHIQPAALFRPTDPVPVAPSRGWLLILDEQQHTGPAARLIDVYQGRVLLVEDHFDRAALGEPWKTIVSTRPKTSLKLEKGAIAIESSPNNCAMTQRPLPAGVTLAECAVFSGSDKGASWGPGLALAWKNKSLRINLRAGGQYGVDDGAGQWFASFVTPNSWHHLRIRLEKNEVLAEGSPDNRLWEVMHAFTRSQFEGDPVAVRIGKMGPGGSSEDYAEAGTPEGACRIKDLRVFGHLAPQ